MAHIKRIDEMVQNRSINNCFNLPSQQECEYIRQECKEYCFNPQLNNVTNLNNWNLLYDKFQPEHSAKHPNEDGYYVEYEENRKHCTFMGFLPNLIVFFLYLLLVMIKALANQCSFLL